MPELEVASNYLEACQSWQEVINAQSTMEDKRAAGHDAMSSLKNQSQYDTRHVIVKGETALHIPDGTSGIEEQIWPVVQFGELVTSGWLGRLHYVGLRQEAFLTWAIYEPRVLGPAKDKFITPDEVNGQEEEDVAYHLPIDKTLRRPLHFPVSLIDYALCHKA